VQFLIKRDRLDKFRFAPLQSSLGREVLARFDIHTFPDGVMLLTDALTPDEHLYQRSDAVAEALQRLGGPGGMWRLVGKALKLLPRPLRDWVTASLPAFAIGSSAATIPARYRRRTAQQTARRVRITEVL